LNALIEGKQGSIGKLVLVEADMSEIEMNSIYRKIVFLMSQITLEKNRGKTQTIRTKRQI